jgi:hypothetical protein
MNTARVFHTSTLLPDGKVRVTGGSDENGKLSSAETYDQTYEVVDGRIPANYRKGQS